MTLLELALGIVGVEKEDLDDEVSLLELIAC